MSRRDGNIWSENHQREIKPATVNDHDDQEHPAWGLIGASRVMSSPPGSTLFDSDIQHQRTIIVRLKTASRRRQLNHDYIYGRDEFAEVEMSEAQWASFVSSMNTGDGVPCTIRRREDDHLVPGLEYEPRLRESMREVHEATLKAKAELDAAFAVAEEKPTKANMRTLKHVIANMPANLEFTAKSLSEHAENVVQRARADIEAMVLAQAKQLGLEPGDLGITPPQLEEGEGS